MIFIMHKSMARLYESAQQLLGVSGQSELARRLGESPQVLNNWEARGISKAGAIKVQAALGIDSNYLTSGRGSPASANQPQLQTCDDLIAAFRDLSPIEQAKFKGALAYLEQAPPTAQSPPAAKKRPLSG